MRLDVCIVLALALGGAAGCTSAQDGVAAHEGGSPSAADAARDVRIAVVDAPAAHDSGPLADASSPTDTGAPEDGAIHPDVISVLPDAGSPPDATRDARVDTGVVATTNDSGISALLALPSADASTCTPVGNIVVCPIGNCLVANPTSTGGCQDCQGQGRCEGHKGASCTRPEDCDIGWACYSGACTLFCNLDAGLGSCAFPSSCTSVGNAYEGVCVP